MPKIIYLSSPVTSQFGGGEVFLNNFTDGIEAEHIFVGSSKAIFDLFRSKNYQATLSSGGFEPCLKYLPLFPVSIIIGFVQFVRFIHLFQSADTIISPTSHCETFFVIPWIKLFFRKKVIFMVHSAFVPKTFSIYPMNWSLSKCWGKSSVVFVSNSQKKLWNDAGCVSKNQMVIYNGVKVSEFVPKTKIDVETKIGFLGRLSSDKGCDVFLDSLTAIKSSERIKVLIGGDGPEKENLVQKLSSLNLPLNITVEFVGFVSDTKLFLESLDLFVFPSCREGFSIVLLECYERGVSALTSNIDPFLEAKSYFNRSEMNLNFAVGGSPDLANKIDFFINNKSLYLDREYQLNLHKTIEHNFGLSKMLADYKKIMG